MKNHNIKVFHSTSWIEEKINFRKLIDLGFYEGQYACKRYCDKKGFKFINNTSSEILDSLKEFIYIKKLNSKQKEKQLKFKNSLPDYFDRYRLHLIQELRL